MENKRIVLGAPKTLKVDIKGIMENLEFTDQKQIALYVGKNGVGKTLILILQWLVGYMVATYLNSGKSMEEYEKIFQIFLDGCFDSNDFTGRIETDYEHLQLSFDLQDGKISNLNITTGQDVLLEMPPPVFMSKNTRLFTDIVKYLKTKKMMGLVGLMNTWDDSKLKDLNEIYKLYDIFFIERMLFRLSDPNFKIHESSLKSFIETMEKEIVKVTYDEANCNFIVYENKDGQEKTYFATTLSSGEQAWLNMFLQH